MAPNPESSATCGISLWIPGSLALLAPRNDQGYTAPNIEDGFHHEHQRRSARGLGKIQRAQL
jgi:hypothetical protein